MFAPVQRDIALLVNKETTIEDIEKAIKKVADKNLFKGSKVFDIYEGKGIEEGKKSLAYSLTFGSNDRTLTDEEINAILEKIIDKLSKIGEVRNK